MKTRVSGLIYLAKIGNKISIAAHHKSKVSGLKVTLLFFLAGVTLKVSELSFALPADTGTSTQSNINITWKSRAPMPTARGQLVVVQANNGKFYAIGGNSLSNNAVLDTVGEYDPSTNIWSLKSPMPTARAGMAAVVGKNGKIYVIGGANGPGALSTVEEYDPIADSWATRASMPTARGFLGSAVAYDGKIYVIGGSSGFCVPLSTVEVYDPATNRWITKASMPTARWAFGTVMHGGKIYAAGGDTACNGAYSVSNATEEYDPLTNH